MVARVPACDVPTQTGMSPAADTAQRTSCSLSASSSRLLSPSTPITVTPLAPAVRMKDTLLSNDAKSTSSVSGRKGVAMMGHTPRANRPGAAAVAAAAAVVAEEEDENEAEERAPMAPRHRCLIILYS